MTTFQQSKLAELLDALSRAAAQNAAEQSREILHGSQPAEIAAVLQSLPHEQRLQVWNALPAEQRGSVLVEMSEGARAVLIRAATPDSVAEVARGLEIDDLADLLAELPEAAEREVLARLGGPERESLRTVLSFAADTAGGLMDVDTVTVRPDVSVAVTLSFLRRRGTLPANTEGLFVLDGDGRFLGVVPLTRLATASPNVLLESLLDRYAPRVDPDMPATEVAGLFQDQDLLSAAVVDRDGHLLGRISSDDVVDVIAEQGESVVRRIGGVPEHDDLFAGPLASTATRTPWLASGFVGAAVTASLVHRFESTIVAFAALAALMPIVASMGGVAAMQTVTVTIRGLARGRINSANARGVIRRELCIAMLSGLLLGAGVLVAVGFWLDNWRIGAAAGAALILSFVAAASIGVLLPLTLQRLRIDPAPAAGLITTSTDAIGYTLLLALATIALSW